MVESRVDFSLRPYSISHLHETASIVAYTTSPDMGAKIF